MKPSLIFRQFNRTNNTCLQLLKKTSAKDFLLSLSKNASGQLSNSKLNLIRVFTKLAYANLKGNLTLVS